MRLAGTAVICVVAAFGAAFLVARASDHGSGSAHSATTVRVQPVTAPVTTTTDTELVSEFTPVRTVLKHRPRPHRHPVSHHVSSPAASSPSAGSVTTAPAYTAPQTATQAAPSYSTPSYTPPASSGGGGSGSSGGSSHKSHGGSGTTTIGG